ncbi:hypothetical protein FGO68_gene185 [Halteria grandinella]|uniref:Uncharacterized protein n=1 Tax=Halteria grandinella TaxID=5974 RepID=A0A8J8T1Z5_HALGN|nr:hypothetical protein FGO68_gene185 [Halteria grandinella]
MKAKKADYSTLDMKVNIRKKSNLPLRNQQTIQTQRNMNGLNSSMKDDLVHLSLVDSNKYFCRNSQQSSKPHSSLKSPIRQETQYVPRRKTTQTLDENILSSLKNTAQMLIQSIQPKSRDEIFQPPKMNLSDYQSQKISQSIDTNNHYGYHSKSSSLYQNLKWFSKRYDDDELMQRENIELPTSIRSVVVMKTNRKMPVKLNTLDDREKVCGWIDEYS